MAYNKPSKLHYRIAQGVCWVVSKTIFRNKVLRNEIKGQKGPFVVIANHQCAYDFVNLICATAQPMHFVISQSFFSSLPIMGFMEKMGVIPKQQFQTTVQDMKQMKTVIDNGAPLVIYPAGLMCEDGLSTPIPSATYKFLKWLGADVYVARSYGSYFVMPKWTKGMRPGKTSIDVYKLFDKDTLSNLEVPEIRKAVDKALLYDAYREQENDRNRYAHNDDLQGLEHVLYMCPNCHAEFTMQVLSGNTLSCSHCGYSQTSDAFGMLHNSGGIGREIRYVSDWSKEIYETLKTNIQAEPDMRLSCGTLFRMVDPQKHKFVDVGSGTIYLDRSGFHLQGTLHCEKLDLKVPIGNIPTLPFSPGKYLEVQNGSDIYRCVLDDGRLVMKFINMVKIFYALAHERQTVCSKE